MMYVYDILTDAMLTISREPSDDTDLPTLQFTGWKNKNVKICRIVGPKGSKLQNNHDKIKKNGFQSNFDMDFKFEKIFSKVVLM